MSNLNVVLDRVVAHDVATDLEDVHAKLDRLLAAVEQLDRRREEIEELVEDLMPAVNGGLAMAMQKLDALEKDGTFALARESAELLANVAPDLLRLTRVATSPEVTSLAERSVAALASGRKGKAPTLWQLLKVRKEPRVRRGLGVFIEILRALGEGTTSSTTMRVAAPTTRRISRAPSSQTASCPSPAAPAATAIRQIAGRSILVDAEGFLANRTEWSKEIANALAAEVGITTLTDRHWLVLDFCRTDAGDAGNAPGMRRITTELGISPKELYALFPKGPGILAARIAGLGKPKSCV